MAEIPPYIEARLRQLPPSGVGIVPGSTPVLSFGSLSKAVVATLGLNPSRVEFLDRDGSELQGRSRRLATLSSLSATDLTHAPRRILSQVVDDCETYFGRNPYRRWFDQLERILVSCGASYYDGSACHLDLVQWATDPTWGGLSRGARSTLLAANAPFLLKQLRNEHLRVLLVNGVSVIRQLQRALELDLVDEPPIVLDGLVRSKIWRATTLGHILVIGWSTNLQSAFGVTSELRSVLRDRVGLLAAGRAAT